MKKGLLLLSVAVVAMSASAQSLVNKVNAPAPLSRTHSTANKAMTETQKAEEDNNSQEVEDDSIIFNPQGEQKLYSMSFTINDESGAYSYSSDKMHVCFDNDGKTV